MNRYFVTINIEGKPFQKFGLEAVSDAKTNVVGIDIGTQTLAYCVRNKYGYVLETGLFELVSEINNEYLKKQDTVNYWMELSRRINNPQNYNKDGTISKGKKEWIESRNYKILKNKNAELGRNKKEAVKKSHSEFVKFLLNKGFNVVIEDMNYSALAKRAKETTYHTKIVNGKEVNIPNKKSRFGKSVLKKSPATFMHILELAVKEVGGTYLKADKFTTKASQYNHQTDTYEKKSLGTRWVSNLMYNGCSVKIQRDIYSAFLLSMLDEDKKIRKDLCDVGFDSFVIEHNKCISILNKDQSQALKNIL